MNPTGTRKNPLKNLENSIKYFFTHVTKDAEVDWISLFAFGFIFGLGLVAWAVYDYRMLVRDIADPVAASGYEEKTALVDATMMTTLLKEFEARADIEEQLKQGRLDIPEPAV